MHITHHGLRNMSTSLTPTITVREMQETAPADLELRLIAGADGLSRNITVPRIQKLGLALAGFANYIHPGRIQIVGGSEVQYLEQLSPERRLEVMKQLPLESMACVLITRGLIPPGEFLETAEAACLPVFVTPQVSSLAIVKMTDFLQKRLAPSVSLHGVMIDMFGLGVLILGESGIGKSECALDLITRGHRLVSDDVVELRRSGYDKIIGAAPLIVRNHMEIRGLGIINIKDLFGISAIAVEKQLDLAIKFERWAPDRNYDRLGLDEKHINILEVDIPLIEIPVTSGRNLATLIEVAVRNHLLKMRGFHAAREFVAKHTQILDKEEGKQ